MFIKCQMGASRINDRSASHYTTRKHRKHRSLNKDSARLMETQPREPVIAADLLENRTEAKKRGGDVITSRFEERRPHGEDFRRYPGERRAAPPLRATPGRLTPLSCACPGIPLVPFFSPSRSPSTARFATSERGEGEVRRHGGEGAQHLGFFTSDGAVKHSLGLIFFPLFPT